MRNIRHYIKMDNSIFSSLYIDKIVKIINKADNTNKYVLLSKIQDFAIFEIIVREIQNTLDNEKLITLFINKFDRNNSSYDYYLTRLLLRSNDMIKLKYLQNVNDESYRYDVANTIIDISIRLRSLDLLEHLFYKTMILRKIDDYNLLRYYKKCDDELGYYVILELKNDYLKESFIDNYNIPKQVTLIKSFKDDLLKQKYIMLDKYKDYIVELISSIQDLEIIKRLFIKQNSIVNKIEILKNIDNLFIKNELVLLLDDSLCKEILLTNNLEKKEEIINNIKLDNIDYDVDPSISIGVELEAIGFFNEKIIELNNILYNWTIKKEASVTEGLEITSPILHFDENSLKQLYYICNFMSRKKFYTNYKCGGHIHIGFEYIETIKELKTLLNLYGNVENILYIISNKVGTKCRTEITRFAKPTNEFLSDIALTNFNEQKITSLKDYSEIIRNKQETRYYGLNLRNINSCYKNTIEFRFPNGEIDFNELVSNIRLFSKLIEVSKKIANTTNTELLDNYNKLLMSDTPCIEKLDILLDMLFDNETEKQIYKDRFDNNKSDILKQKTFKIK